MNDSNKDGREDSEISFYTVSVPYLEQYNVYFFAFLKNWLV